MHSFSLLSLVVLHHLVISVRADTSLFIPGFDPQPLSVGDLGTDGQGRTTWEIVPGSLTGTFTEPAFIGTATLVEGPNDAHLVYNNPEISVTLDIQCGINNGNAACTGIGGFEEVTTVVSPTQPVEPFVVQGGGPLTVSSSQATPSGSSVLPSETSKASGFITTTKAPSSSATSSPSSAGSNDARSNIVVQIPLVVAFAVMTAVLV
ncbi:hypothetical protein V8E53_007020 [Lactarius tabidus]